MDIGLAVDRQTFVVGKQFCPQLTVAGECPVVFVEAAPEDGSAILVEVLLDCNSVIEMTDIHDADRIISFTIDCYTISSDDIDRFFRFQNLDIIACTTDCTLCGDIGWTTDGIPPPPSVRHHLGAWCRR